MGFDWAARLESLLEGRSPQGQLATEAEKRAFVAFSLVKAIRDVRPTTLAPAALTLLGELTVAAGVLPGEPAPVLLQKLDAHMENNPPPAWMLADFAQLVREAVLAGEGAAVGAAFAQFTGTGGSGVLGGGERPVGTTPGGPLARFAFTKKP